MRALVFGLTAALAVAVPATAQADKVTVTKAVEADATTTMQHEVLVDAGPAEVWAAIATAEGWMTWAVPVARVVCGDPDLIESSYDPAATPGGPDTIRQRFGERTQGKRLAFRTIKAPAGFPHWDDYQKVTSVFEIEAAGQQTRVRLTSRGYPGSDGGRALVGFFEAGNAMALGHLRQRFATGPIDWAAMRR